MFDVCILFAGNSGTEDFIHCVFGVTECLAQHSTILLEHQVLVIDKILPPLAALVSSSGGTPSEFEPYPLSPALLSSSPLSRLSHILLFNR